MDQSTMARSTEEKVGMSSDSDFSRIEELIKENTFSREEISHLMEILNSRVENVLEKQKSRSSAGEDTQLVSWTNEIQRTPYQQKHQDFGRAMIGTSHEKSDIPAGVSASPIDIARAYMAGRTTEGGHGPYNSTSKSERAQPSNEFARKPLLPPPSPMPSICWPGAMVHERHGYATPQIHTARHRLRDFPRTPYSRTIQSKSTTKLQPDSAYASTSTPIQQSETSIYGQVKSRADIVDVYGSVGPIRRIRNKFASEVRPRGSILLSSLKETPKSATSKVFGGFLASAEKNLEHGETSGASKYWSGDNLSEESDRTMSNSNLSRGLAVRKILENLDKPTPKEKEAEMKSATVWGRFPETTNTIREENKRSVQVQDIASGPRFPVDFNKSSTKSKFLASFNDKSTDKEKDAVNGNAQASTTGFTGSSTVPGASAMPIFGSKGTSGPVFKNFTENAFSAAITTTNNQEQARTNQHFSRPPLINGQDVNHNGTNKPSLSSISVKRSDYLRADNGPGFTFPVSASAGVLSEPPTPSMTPSSSPDRVSHQPTAVPSYTFGTDDKSKSTPRLVFSFPSTSSSAAAAGDDSDIKFSFGSDKETRLSFSSFEKDAICY